MLSSAIPRDNGAYIEKQSIVVKTDTCLEDAPFRSVKPLSISLSLFGLWHRSGKEGKWATLSKVYASVVLLMIWAIVIRSFTLYQPEKLASYFVLKVIIHCWSFHCACCATTTFLACRKQNKFVEFLSRWSNLQKRQEKFPGDFIQVSSNPFLKRAKFGTDLCFAFSWFALVTSCALVGYMYFGTDIVDFLLLPLTPKSDYVYLLKCLYFASFCYADASWIFTICLFYEIGAIIYTEFKMCHEKFEKAVQSDGNKVDVERFRRLHQDVCLLVESADDILSGFSAVSIVVSTVNGMLVLYNIMWNPEVSAYTGVLLTNVFWLCSCLFYLGVIAVGGGYLNQLAHSPLKTIHNIQLKSQSAEFSLQMTMFLNKLSGEPIGLTAMGMFVINRPTILTIAGAFITYFIVLVQFQQSPGSQGSFTNFTASYAG